MLVAGTWINHLNDAQDKKRMFSSGIKKKRSIRVCSMGSDRAWSVGMLVKVEL